MSGARERRRGSFAQVWSVVRPHQRFLWLSLALLLVNAAARLAQPWLVKTAIDQNLVGGSLDGFYRIIGALAGIAVVEWFARRYQMLALERAGQDALLGLRRRVFSHLQRLPMSFFDRTPTGRLVGRATTDVEALQEIFSSGVVTVLGDLVFLVAAVAILLTLDVHLTLAALCIVPVFLGVTAFVRRYARAAYSELRNRISQMNADLHEQVSGMPIVQLFGQERASAARFAESNDGVRDSQLRSVFWESILSAVTEMLGSFTTALILWFGGTAVLGGEAGLTLGTLYAFVDYMQRMFVPLNDLTMKYTVLQSALVAGDRIFGLLDEPIETPDPVSPRRATGSGRVEFDRVTFGYETGRPVLVDFDLTVEPGEKVAIVGATGAGKTTILSILTRLYDIQSGSIRIDGVDVREMARADLRRQVGVVAQDVFLFRGSILDNVRLGHPEVSATDAIAAANELHLEEVVARFPGGYREPVAERGRNLSAGEQQLIAFARMLVVAPKVLALDEATSNVDSHTEQLLQDAVHRLMAGRDVDRHRTPARDRSRRRPDRRPRTGTHRRAGHTRGAGGARRCLCPDDHRRRRAVAAVVSGGLWISARHRGSRAGRPPVPVASRRARASRTRTPPLGSTLRCGASGGNRPHKGATAARGVPAIAGAGDRPRRRRARGTAGNRRDGARVAPRPASGRRVAPCRAPASRPPRRTNHSRTATTPPARS